MMLCARLRFSLRSLLLAPIVSSVALGAAGQKVKQSIVLSAPAATGSAVSLVWYADDDARFRGPITIYAVADNDPRLHSVDVHGREGWSAYMTAQEMERILERLRSFDLKWEETSRPHAMEHWESKLTGDTLETIVTSSRGAARDLTYHAICERLAEMDSALAGPRVLRQFQQFRVERGCHVHGFSSDAAPPE